MNIIKNLMNKLQFPLNAKIVVCTLSNHRMGVARRRSFIKKSRPYDENATFMKNKK
jgi:hypothetical protein